MNIFLITQIEYDITEEGRVIKDDVIGLVHSINRIIKGQSSWEKTQNHWDQQIWDKVTHVVYLDSYKSEPPADLLNPLYWPNLL